MRLNRLFVSGLLALFLLALGCVSLFWLALRDSRPQLNGEHRLAGLSAPVDVPRDKLGVPTIVAANRVDAARALGFIHAQERFFQMDLLRRNAAGELAELVGPAALPLDRSQRLHRFRARAERAIAAASATDGKVLNAYTAGVNAGLNALGTRPFEYLLLRAKPSPWRAADTLLTLYSMFLDLNDELGARDRETGELQAALPLAVAQWLNRRGSAADAALDGSVDPTPPLPAAADFDLRSPELGLRDLLLLSDAARLSEAEVIGSNNFAVGGALTAHGGAMLASDMHLGLKVPPIWFRVRLRFTEDGAAVDATGVTLPGVPGMIAGSNGSVAWGFTNSYADVTDLVQIELDPTNDAAYRAGDGSFKAFVQFDEQIAVKGAQPERLQVRWTEFGPLLPAIAGEPLYAARWTAHAEEAATLGLDQMLYARDVRAGIAVCQAAGMPLQNVLLTDRSGAIAWTLCGRLPARDPARGSVPMSSADAATAWSGWLPPSEVPLRSDPPDARLWTANARPIGGNEGIALGDGDFDYGQRALQIRDRLREKDRFSARDLYAIQLDDEARYLLRWQDLLAATLSDEVLSVQPQMKDFLRLTGETPLHAAPDSVAYLLLREFRQEVSTRALAPFIALVKQQHAGFTGEHLRQREAVVWDLLGQRPAHLLNPLFDNWDALLLDSALAAQRGVQTRFGSLRGANWGSHNTSNIRHPLSAGIPWLAPLLDMPRRALAGDVMMPRVQGPAVGASERFVVAPGREQEGIFTLPGGQSGHPLSPYYRRGFAAWARGEPMPFLPLPTRYRLVLTP